MVFKKSQLGWRLLRSSITVFWKHKKLLIFPLIGRGIFFMILLAITTLVWMVNTGIINYNRLSTREIVWIYVIVLAVLWIGNIVSAFFNAALTACLRQEQQGQEIRLSAGFGEAGRRFWTIFCWIIAHFTFGIFIMIFRSQLDESGRINRLLSGLPWRTASFLVTPLIVNQPAGFIPTLQRSSRLMREYAGKNPRINYGYGWLSLSLRILSFVPMAVTSSPIGIVLTCILLLMVMVLFNGTAIAILQGLYQFIAHGQTIPHFRTKDLTAAITPKE